MEWSGEVGINDDPQDTHTTATCIQVQSFPNMSTNFRESHEEIRCFRKHIIELWIAGPN